MSSETERLEKEAEEHRGRLDDTLSNLRGRLSLGDIVEEVSGYVNTGAGKEFAGNFGRQVRDNPLALGLVGAGLAWLFLGDSARTESSRLARRAEAWRENRAYDDFEGAFPEDGPDDYARHARGSFSRAPLRPVSGEPVRRADTIGRSGPARYGDPYGVLGTGEGSDASSGPGAGERMRAAGDRAKEAGADARDRASSAAGDARARIGSAASDAKARASGAAGDAQDRMREGYDRARRRGSEAYAYAEDEARHLRDEAYRGGRRLQRTVVDTLREEPLVVGAVAIAIGAAIGAAMPSSRQEDRYLGPARDRLRDEALSEARDLYDRGEDVARRSYEAASDKADEEGLKPSGEADKTLAEKVESVGQAATDAAKREADRKNLT